MIEYLDFDVLITRAGDAYRARIIDSPGGQASADFALPFNEAELAEFRQRLDRPRFNAGGLEAARDFGGRLFDAVFDGEMLATLRASLVRAAAAEKGLRLRLRFGNDAAELGDVPWETLYYATLDRFFVLSAATPLTRFLEMPEAAEPLLMEPPLNVLIAVSSPGDLDMLDVEREWSVIDDALNHLVGAGYITVERLEPATLSALHERLASGTYHIFHFIGHGAYDESTDTGELMFETDDDRARPVSGSELGTLLHDHRTLRLAVLNACVSGRTSEKSQFRGVAQRLIQQGTPAVVAMQSSISDLAAVAISSRFYGALASGFAVDAALAEGRRAVFALGDNVEWATPVLYLRAPDARIFDFGDSVDERLQPGERETGVPQRAKADDLTPTISTGLEKVEILAHDPRVDIESVYGDLVQGDKIIHGDSVGGDKISVGNITGSHSIAIGRGAQAGSTGGAPSPFDAVRQEIEQMPLDEDAKEEAEFAVKQIEKQNDAPEPDVDRIDRWLSVLEDVAPAAVEILVNAVTNPGAAASAGVRLAIKTWRQSRQP